jgi:hypothetical protein
MKKRKLFNTLAKKYNLPVKYVSFKLNPYYIYKADIEQTLEWCMDFENRFNWEYIKEDFERDRNRYSSIFYGM